MEAAVGNPQLDITGLSDSILQLLPDRLMKVRIHHNVNVVPAIAALRVLLVLLTVHIVNIVALTTRTNSALNQLRRLLALRVHNGRDWAGVPHQRA